MSQREADQRLPTENIRDRRYWRDPAVGPGVGEGRLSHPLQTFIMHDLRSDEPHEGQLDRGEGNEGGQGFGKVLEVLGETPVSAEPGEGALDQGPLP